MLRKVLRRANPVALHKVFFASVGICLSLFVFGCTQAQDSAENAQDPAELAKGPAQDARSVELREAEHKTVRHPEKRYYAAIWPDGLQVSFETAQGHFGSYTFPRNAFPAGEPALLSCPGSPDLLPMRVVRLNGEADQRYRIEWLAEPPSASDGTGKVVRSY